jgi:hypothetical protein
VSHLPLQPYEVCRLLLQLPGHSNRRSLPATAAAAAVAWPTTSATAIVTSATAPDTNFSHFGQQSSSVQSLPLLLLLLLLQLRTAQLQG